MMENKNLRKKLSLGTKYRKIDAEVWSVKKQAAQIKHQNQILHSKLAYLMKQNKKTHFNQKVPSKTVFKQMSKQLNNKQLAYKSCLTSEWKQNKCMNQFGKQTHIKIKQLKKSGKGVINEGQRSSQKVLKQRISNRINIQTQKQEQQQIQRERIVELIVQQYQHKLSLQKKLTNQQKFITQNQINRESVFRKYRKMNRKILYKLKKYKRKTQKMNYKLKNISQKLLENVEYKSTLSWNNESKTNEGRLENLVHTISHLQDKIAEKQQNNSKYMNQVKMLRKKIIFLLNQKNRIRKTHQSKLINQQRI